MARKDRSLAGFDDVAEERNNENNNDNGNLNINNNDDNIKSGSDTIDKILGEGNKKKDELVLTGVYLQPELAKILDRLGKQGGRGAKSGIVNDALRKLFDEKGLL